MEKDLPRLVKECPVCNKRAMAPVKWDSLGRSYEYQCAVCTFCMFDPELIIRHRGQIAKLEAERDEANRRADCAEHECGVQAAESSNLREEVARLQSGDHAQSEWQPCPLCGTAGEYLTPAGERVFPCNACGGAGVVT